MTTPTAPTPFQNRPSHLHCIVEQISTKPRQDRSYNQEDRSASKAARDKEVADLNQLPEFQSEKIKEPHFMKWLASIVTTSHLLLKEAEEKIPHELLQNEDDTSDALADALLALSVVKPSDVNGFWNTCGIKKPGVNYDEANGLDLQLCKRQTILGMLRLAESDKFVSPTEEHKETPKEKKQRAQAKQQLQEERENTSDFRVVGSKKRPLSSISTTTEKKESDESTMPSSSSSAPRPRPLEVYLEMQKENMEEMRSKHAAEVRKADLEDVWERLRSETSYLTTEDATEVLGFFSREGFVRAIDLDMLDEEKIDDIEKKLKTIPRKKFLRLVRPDKKEI